MSADSQVKTLIDGTVKTLTDATDDSALRVLDGIFVCVDRVSTGLCAAWWCSDGEDVACVSRDRRTSTASSSTH